MTSAQEAFIEWYGQDVGGPTSYTLKQGFLAGYRAGQVAALTDAAEAWYADENAGAVTDWLRARAAEVDHE